MGVGTVEVGAGAGNVGGGSENDGSGLGRTVVGKNEAIAFGGAGADETVRFTAGVDSRLRR